MVMALFIVAMILYIIHASRNPQSPSLPDKTTRNLLWIALITSLIQVVLGTQVRQFVDEQSKIMGENAPQLWLDTPSIAFYLHRSFSIFVILLNVFLATRIFKKKLGYTKINWVLALLFLEVITGMAMYYMDFPFSSQPLHLVIASVLFGFQFYLVLEAIYASKTTKTL